MWSEGDLGDQDLEAAVHASGQPVRPYHARASDKEEMLEADLRAGLQVRVIVTDAKAAGADVDHLADRLPAAIATGKPDPPVADNALAGSKIDTGSGPHLLLLSQCDLTTGATLIP